MGRCSDCCHIVAFDEVMELQDGFLGIGEGFWCVRKIKPIQDPDSHIGCELFEPDIKKFTPPPKWVPPVQSVIVRIGVGESPVRCSMCQEYKAPTYRANRPRCLANTCREIGHVEMPRICPDYQGSMRINVGKGRPYQPPTPISVISGAEGTEHIGHMRPYEVTVRGTMRIRVYARTPEGAAKRAAYESELVSPEIVKVRKVRE